MKLSTGVRSLINNFIFLSLALSLQACGGGGGGVSLAAPAISNASSQSYLEDVTITTFAFSNTGGGSLTNCSADSLPAGLSIAVSSDSSTCEISGTPSTPIADTVFTITATNSTASDTATVSIVVPANTLSVTVSSAGIKTVKFDWAAYSNAVSYKLFVNSDGVSGFTLLQDNLTGSSSTITLSAHLTDWINASYILEAHNNSGKLKASSPVSITSLMLSSIGYFKASNTDADDAFGEISLSGDGNTLVVGAYKEDSNYSGISTDGTGEADNSASSAGAVYVYTRSSGVWSQQAYIKASNAEANDSFGISTSLSFDGNTLVVGATNERSNFTGTSTDGTGESDNSASNSGAVYVFTRSGAVWSQQTYIKASNAEANDLFGDSISLSSDGNSLVVAARNEASNATGISTDGTGETDNSASGAGAVYFFTQSGGVWSQQAYIKASNTEAFDHFNVVRLSADGNTLAVGAKDEDSNATGISTNGTGETDNSAVFAGAVYIYSRSAGIWSQQAYVKASNTEPSDAFGRVISLNADGNTLVVTAIGEDSNATGISTDGTGENDNTATSSGAVYVYLRNNGAWSQQAYIKASNAEIFDKFGSGVSLSADGSMLAVGADFEESNATGVSMDGTGEADRSAQDSGAVYIFKRSGSVWTQQSYVKASNTEYADNFGFNVSISADGATMAVGAELEDSNAKGVNGSQTDNSAADTGAVYVY